MRHDGVPTQLQPNTLFVAIASYGVHGPLGWTEEMALVLNGPLAGAIVRYDSGFEHSALSTVVTTGTPCG